MQLDKLQLSDRGSFPSLSALRCFWQASCMALTRQKNRA
jgi:hypothetical protein